MFLGSMGLYGTTPDALQHGGSFLSSIVVVNSVQGLVQLLTLPEIVGVQKKSLWLLPLMKATFIAQPFCSLAVMYSGYHLLKHIRMQLLFPGIGNGILNEGEQGSQTGSPTANNSRPTVVRQRAGANSALENNATFIAFGGRGFTLDANSDVEAPVEIGEVDSPLARRRRVNEEVSSVQDSGGVMKQVKSKEFLTSPVDGTVVVVQGPIRPMAVEYVVGSPSDGVHEEGQVVDGEVVAL